MFERRKTSVELSAEATTVRQTSVKDTVLPRRSKTRVGKARLMTLDILDARTAAAKEAHRLVAELTEDRTEVSVGERQLITRAALLGAIVSDFEARWVAGETIPLGEYFSAVNVQRRVLATLGLKREQKTISWRDRWLADVAAEGDAAVEAETVPVAVSVAAEAVPDDAEDAE